LKKDEIGVMLADTHSILNSLNGTITSHSSGICTSLKMLGRQLLLKIWKL